MPAVSTDRIEKEILLRAPRARVWKALTDSKQFGEWFGIQLQEGFVPGARVTGQMLAKGWEHVKIDFNIDRIDPETYFSYRWHPFAIDPKVDYSTEPTTLVEFRLEEVEGGTRLRTIESGFDRIPAARRDEAFRMNDGGWTSQITIANTSSVQQTVRVDFFNAFGAPMTLPFGSSISTVVIAPGGVVTLSTGL
jgi:uncharacterized protein YndB with AHSA1/START domain